MADTIRSQADLLTLLVDNTTGNIGAQDIRDMLVSVFGVAGALKLYAGSTAQAGITTTPEKFTGFDTNGPAIETTPDHTDDSIILSVPGFYVAAFNISFSGTINSTWTFEMAEDGVGSGWAFKRKLSAGGDVGDASCFGLFLTTTGSEKISVLVNSDQGGGASVTASNAQLIVFKVA